MTTTSSPMFRNAPPDSYVSEEGWLIVGDEAWLPEEWTGKRRMTDDERLAAKRRSSRESMRRMREARRAHAA